MDWAFEYVIGNGGLDTEDSYPYEAQVSEIGIERQTMNSFKSAKTFGFQQFFLVNSHSELSLQDGYCRFNPATVGATCTGYVDITSEDENALQEAVATIGPISVAIDASHLSFQLYDSGESHTITD